MRKTVALWVVLIVLFIAFWNIFSKPRDPNAPPPPPAAPISWTQTVVNWSVPAALFIGFIVYVRWAQNRAKPAHEGVRMLNQGRYAQALEVFVKVREKQPAEPIAVYNCGISRLFLWQLEAALKDLELTRSLPGAKGPIAALLPEHLALTYALLGRATEANQALTTVPKELGEPARVALAAGIIQLREGDAAGARAKLGSVEVKQLGGAMGALARTADAFCVERLTQELRHVDRIALFGEVGPEGLRKAWPELVAFVERAPAW